jgi:hypothetical protein
VPTALSVSPASVVPEMAADVETVRADDFGNAVADAPPPRVEAPASKALRRARIVERSLSPSRAQESALRLQVQNIAARTRTAAARGSVGCDGLAVLSQVLCTLRLCKSPHMSAEPKCVRGRQIEQARQRRMERE